MLNDYFLEKFFLQKEVQKMSVSEQSKILHIFDCLMVQIREENHDVTISELLSTDLS